MRRIRLGIVGFGKVIQAFLELISEKKEYLSNRYHLELAPVAICDSTEYMLNCDGFDPAELLALKLAKQASGESMEGSFSSDLQYIIDTYLQTQVDLVIEALPPDLHSGEPALSYLSAFLTKKVPAITINKSPLVFGYKKLISLSKKNQVPFYFSGATAAALPTVDIASIALAGTEIYGFEGILNGTTNFLLSEMINNQTSIEEETTTAVEMKICEPDPAFDIDGWDTAFKTLILARAFIDPEIELSEVDRRGVRNLTYADVEPVLKEGNTVKLLGKSGFEGERLRLRVTPSIITRDHPFYKVEGTSKAISFFTDTMGKLTLVGGATSLKETAATILKDVINICTDSHQSYRAL